jgi:diguanylate cyclase (GGDEF)-like protein
LDGQRRAYDTLGRVGGEEFALLLPEVPPLDAVKVADRWRAAVEQASLGGLPAGAVTVSIGLAEGPIDDSDGCEAIYKRADDKLYEAKHGGRNRVCAAKAAPSTEPPASSRITLEPPK